MKKSIASNAKFNGLWKCAQNIDGIYETSECRKISENYTHLICGCNLKANRIEITAILNRDYGHLTRQCILESFQLYQPEADFSFVDQITDGKCFPFHFSLNGLFFILIYFVGITGLFNFIVFLVDKGYDPTKPNPYSEILSFIPLYSIFKAPSLPYDSRFLRTNYFVCHVIDILGVANINRELAWALGINYWLQLFTFGLFSIFALQYGTAALWNYLYKVDFGSDFQTKKINKRARYIIIILCWIFWIVYFILRWGVNPWEEQRFRLFGGLVLLGADVIIFDPLIALICYKFKRFREFIKYRGYYTPYRCADIVYGTNFDEKVESVPMSGLTSARDMRSFNTSRTMRNETKYIIDPRAPELGDNNMRDIISELENRS